MLVFDWDEENIGHIARHGVTPHDVEYALTHPTLELEVQDWHSEEDRIAEVGTTAHVRFLVAVTTMRGTKIRVVTAYDPPRHIASAYVKARGR